MRRGAPRSRSPALACSLRRRRGARRRRAGDGPAPMRQLMVFRDGTAVNKRRGGEGGPREGRPAPLRRGRGTALAALVRSRTAGSGCGTSAPARARAATAAELFVARSAASATEARTAGSTRSAASGATAGAADPSAPFGRGRLRGGQRVTWFYCRLRGGGCQRTLELTAAAARPGAGGGQRARLRRRGRGRGRRGGDRGHSRRQRASPAAGGTRPAQPGAGAHYGLRGAASEGLVRSFAERVTVR